MFFYLRMIPVLLVCFCHIFYTVFIFCSEVGGNVHNVGFPHQLLYSAAFKCYFVGKSNINQLISKHAVHCCETCYLYLNWRMIIIPCINTHLVKGIVTVTVVCLTTLLRAIPL